MLWMPTLSEKRTPYFCRERVSRKIEDSKLLGGYYLEGRIEPSLDIVISYRRTGFLGFLKKLFGDKDAVVRFHKESEILNRGFIQYSCDLPDEGLDEVQKGLYGMMRSPLYHFVKAFYHNHTHHHASQDSLLQAYVSNTMVDLKAEYEQITLYYIQQYRDLLIDFNEETTGQIEIAKGRLNRTHKVKQSIATLGDIIKAGNELNGQLGYMDFLINKLARPYSVSKELRAEITRLRNNVQVILKDASTSYNVSTAALGVKYGIQGIRWGIGGVVVSCAIFGLSTYLTSTDRSTEKLIEDVKRDIVQKDSASIKREADSIRKGIDKLDERLNKVEKTLRKENLDVKILERCNKSR